MFPPSPQLNKPMVAPHISSLFAAYRLKSEEALGRPTVDVLTLSTESKEPLTLEEKYGEKKQQDEKSMYFNPDIPGTDGSKGMKVRRKFIMHRLPCWLFWTFCWE